MTTNGSTDTGRSVALLLAAATALSIAACSSSAGHGPAVDTAFVSKANAICAVAVARQNSHAVPVRNFDPLHPKPQDLPAVGNYFAAYGGAAKTAKQLDALAPPSKQKTNWTTLRGLIDQVGVNAQRQIAAAQGSDVSGFEKTVTTSQSLAKRIDQVGPEVGFTSKAPCRKVFG